MIIAEACMVLFFITAITGSILTVIWILFCLMTKNIQTAGRIYRGLKIVMAGYIVPIVMLCWSIRGLFTGGLDIFYPLLTARGQKILNYSMIVYVIGLVHVLCRQIPQVLCLSRMNRECIRAKMEIRQRLEQIKQKIGIRRKVEIYQGYGILSPYVYGVFHPRIYLPIEILANEELDMILRHELYHIKHGDNFWKPMFSFVCWLYWFNPLAWLTLREVGRWAEGYCDECCTNANSPHEYFSTIYRLEIQVADRMNMLVPMWSENERELKWRVKRIMNSKRLGKVKRVISVIVCIIAIMLGSFSVIAVSTRAEKRYNSWYMDSMYIHEELDTRQEYMETFAYEYVLQEPDYEQNEVSSEKDAGRKSVVAEIESNGSYMADTFEVESGIEISFLIAIRPNDMIVKMCLLCPDGTMKCVDAQENFAYVFTVQQSGLHSICIVNENSEPITVEGWFSY